MNPVMATAVMPVKKTGYTTRQIWECECVCMGSSYCCIVACTHIGNGTGRRTATMAAPLLLTSGPVRHEAVFHSCGPSAVGAWGGCTHSW